MKVFSYIILLLAAFEMYRTWRVAIKGNLSPRFAVLWFTIWLLLAIFILFPGSVNAFTLLMGMENSLFFLLLAGVMLLYVLTYQIFVEMKKNSMAIIKITQRLALLESSLKVKGTRLPEDNVDRQENDKLPS